MYLERYSDIYMRRLYVTLNSRRPGDQDAFISLTDQWKRFIIVQREASSDYWLRAIL